MAVTAASLKARYPVFDGVADALVNAVLNSARRQVGDTWTETDRDEGVELYAAHLLTIEDALGGGQGSTMIDSNVSSRTEKLGDATVTVAQSAQTGSMQASVDRVAGGLQSTPFGRRYAVLLKQNAYGPLVA